ncbi:hypothetical protein N9043_00860 [bacterium]|nr:hypothetical protein [bacterium]
MLDISGLSKYNSHIVYDLYSLPNAYIEYCKKKRTYWLFSEHGVKNSEDSFKVAVNEVNSERLTVLKKANVLTAIRNKNNPKYVDRYIIHNRFNK